MHKKSTCTIVAIILVCTLFALSLVGCSAQAGSPQATATPGRSALHVLVFSKTTGFRHASIGDGIIALRQLASEHHASLDASEDAAVFTTANLARYQVVVFLSTTGTILDAGQKAAFVSYIHAGGGYVGIHSASDTEHQWPWYGQLVGAFFKSHPQIAPATVHVEDRCHPSTSMLPSAWSRTDEWYNFATNPRLQVHVLLTVDESSYRGGSMGRDHPIAWYHSFEGGRAWYTAMGHTSASFSESLFLAHLWGGITYAAGQAAA